MRSSLGKRCRARSEEKIGRKLTDWPKALNSDGMLQRQWREFRREHMKTILSHLPGNSVSIWLR